jgi:hypothetical protein
MNRNTGREVLELLTAILLGFVLLVISLDVLSADNEIFIDQSGATSNWRRWKHHRWC